MARMLGMIVLVALVATGAAYGSDTFSFPPAPLPYMFGGQTTVVWQYHPAFRSPYQGPNSLHRESEDAVSHSYTLYTGVRLQPWLDLYVDPEMIRGAGIGSGVGLAGYTNGEVIRNPEAGQGPYLGRAFLRATVPLGQDSEEVDPDLLQVGGSRPAQRIVLTGGVLAAADLFDTNRYANAARTQFLNWSFINNTAWDFAADTRGYSRGGAIEWIEEAWSVRLGSFQMPAGAAGLAQVRVHAQPGATAHGKRRHGPLRATRLERRRDGDLRLHRGGLDDLRGGAACGNGVAPASGPPRARHRGQRAERCPRRLPRTGRARIRAGRRTAQLPPGDHRRGVLPGADREMDRPDGGLPVRRGSGTQR